MTATQTKWRISGDYFENCNCDLLCPCLVGPGGPLTAQPTQGECVAPLAFHIDSGSYGDVQLDGLNTVVLVRSPGVMAEGNLDVAVYIDERADDQQRDALTSIFSGAAGGPMGALGPLVGNVLGIKTVSIDYQQNGKTRSVKVPDVMSLSVTATPGADPDSEQWLTNTHPLFPERIAPAVGGENSVVDDYGIRWDNSGKSGAYAPFTWEGN